MVEMLFTRNYIWSVQWSCCIDEGGGRRLPSQLHSIITVRPFSILSHHLTLDCGQRHAQPLSLCRMHHPACRQVRLRRLLAGDVAAARRRRHVLRRWRHDMQLRVGARQRRRRDVSSADFRSDVFGRRRSASTERGIRIDSATHNCCTEWVDKHATCLMSP